MKRRAFFAAIFLGLLFVAVVGWTVEGLRWAFTGSRAKRPRYAAASRFRFCGRAPRSLWSPTCK